MDQTCFAFVELNWIDREHTLIKKMGQYITTE
jgi:hypothetical protein